VTQKIAEKKILKKKEKSVSMLGSNPDQNIELSKKHVCLA
jgi:hypothetical protein